MAKKKHGKQKPKSIIKEKGQVPAEEPNQRTLGGNEKAQVDGKECPGLTRRVFMAVLGVAGVTGWDVYKKCLVDPAIEKVKVKLLEFFQPRGTVASQEVHQRLDLIVELFLSSEPDIEFVPPTDWDHAPPDIVLPDGSRTYGHEFEVLSSIANCFPRDLVKWEYQDASWRVHQDKSQVFLASGVSNAASRLVIGTPDQPLLNPRFGDRVTPLHYGITRAQGHLKRWQYGELIERPSLAICDRNNRRLLQAEPTEALQRDDYLLVTRIPGGRPKTVLSVFSGLHGPGTRAAELLFSRISIRDLEELASRIGHKSGHVPHYQAVFRASKFEKIGGSSVATHIELETEKCPPKRLG